MLNQAFIEAKLALIGPKYLKNRYKLIWSKDNPTAGYCYLISEILYHYIYPNSKTYCINLGELGTHWFIKVDNQIIDYTAKQFSFDIPYEHARCCGFFKGGIITNRGYISKNAYFLAKDLGVINL